MNFIQTVYATSEPVEEANVQTTAEHTTEAPASGGVAASLGINAQLFAFQLINFAVVALILWFLILKPLSSKLEERKKIIDDSLEKAKEVDANLLMAQEKFAEKVDEAKGEANKIIEKAHSEAEVLANDMKVKAKKEIEGLVDNAKVKIQDEKEKSLAEVRNEAANLVVAAVEKILNEKLDSKKDKELIEESLKKLK